jgi:formamidopyrimidine-DNA glycosylase
MPELPEVECLRRSLLPALVGGHVMEARLLRRDVLRDPSTARRGVTDPGRLLLGATFLEPTRLGKHLALRTIDGRTLEIHLGMSGQLLLSRTPLQSSHIHATWLLAPPPSARTLSEAPWYLTFRDPRRFGGLWAFGSMDELAAHRWSSLGPDALAITSEHLLAHAGSSTRTLKAALLDQRLLAGVGNIYADEALFRARLHPRTRCNRLTLQHWHSLAEAVRQILASAIAVGGSTLRDYTTADGQPGSMQASHQVYARGGLPCLRCRSTTLNSATLAQRTTVWCPTCQPARVPKMSPPMTFST